MWSGQECVIIGQGIDETIRESLRSQLALSGVTCISHIDALAPLALTHKRSRSAVLIGAPRRTGPRCYEYGFVMNDVLDRLSDRRQTRRPDASWSPRSRHDHRTGARASG